MKRGEIWTVSGGSGYAGKPRPAVIVQSDRYLLEYSVTVCGLTTDPSEAPLTRPLMEPTAANGLLQPSRVMADKITTVQRSRFGKRIGMLAPEDMARVEQALLLVLGFGD